MGNAGTATFSEAEAGYYNPAAWGSIDRSDLQFTHVQWLADISFNYAAVCVKKGTFGTIALTLTSLNSGEIDVRTVEQPLGTGEKYSVTNTAIGVGYALQLTDRFSAGVLVSYVQETIWHSSLSAFSVNLGTLYKLSAEGLQIGASISNFGTRARYSGSDLRIRFDNDAATHGDNSNLPGEVYTEEYSLPIVFRVGAAYPLTLPGDNKLLLTLDAIHPSDNSESITFGLEFKLLNLIALRGGYQQLFLKDSEVGLTLGGGLDQDFFGFPLHVDYAWASHGRLISTQRITIGFQF
jgi:hypothetical protein